MRTRTPQALVLETVRSAKLALCANLMLRFVRIASHCIALILILNYKVPRLIGKVLELAMYN